ncbi:hypothetical protein HII36_45715 [Nonomuraea sp. NN258]|uniref:hypothetical protein n=1 Tax=Nonomuraea antri TaxID=2730852 RepID=UPI001569F0E4|nr:hypothetical protein [Nonomuraea antri]NRQ39073.1 hypothetical protein [Nonomuraea antri]
MAEPEEPAVEGWHLDSKWFGLEAERDGVTYNAKKIAASANVLREALKAFNGQGEESSGGRGSIEDLTEYGTLADLRMKLQGVARWEGGQLFAKALEKSHQEFLEAYQDVLRNFEIAIALVDAGAGNYSKASAANEGEE